MFTNFEFYYANKSKEEIERELKLTLDYKLKARYGQEPHEEIVKRVTEEWDAMERTETTLEVAALHELSLNLNRNGLAHLSHGSTGSSLILYLLDITSNNPLPAHIYDQKTEQTEFYLNILDGFDLVVELTNRNLIADGHHIPWQTLWGMNADYEPAFNLHLPTSLEPQAAKFLEKHWLNELKENIKTIKYPRSWQLSKLYFAFTIADPKIDLVKSIDRRCFPLALERWEEILEVDSLRKMKKNLVYQIPRIFPN